MRIIFKIVIALCFLITVSCDGKKRPGSIFLQGEYNGKNIKVQNPYAENGIGYCMSEIYVNGKVTTDEINADTFEIDLEAAGLKPGDKVNIELRHLNGCTPKILNPEVLN